MDIGMRRCVYIRAKLRFSTALFKKNAAFQTIFFPFIDKVLWFDDLKIKNEQKKINLF